MGKLYVGDFGKINEYFVPTTNFQEHPVTINFDGSRFLKTDDALFIGLHVTSVDGLNEKSKCTMPCSMLFKLNTKPYEYESGFGDSKKKATVEPTNREKILYWYLTSESDELNYEKNQGKGGMITFGDFSNDAAILAGEGNPKKHSRFVVEFDEDIKPFDMSGDSFSLDGIASGTAKTGKNYSSKPVETEAQRIEARIKAIEALVKNRKAYDGDPTPAQLQVDTMACMHEPKFITLACLVLALPIPSNLTHWDI
jgi:hypothetical protein